MQQSSGGFRLIVRRGPQPNQIYELSKDVVTIGRDITNDITINDPEVSRHHARLNREGDSYVIEDLGSTNGTFVNGQRLSGSRLLAPGETIGMGETVTLAYESTAFPGAAAPAPSAPGGPARPDYAPPVNRGEPAAANPNPYAPPGSPAAQSSGSSPTPPPNQQQPYYQQQGQGAPPPGYAAQPGGYDQAPPPGGGYAPPSGYDQPPSPYGYAAEEPQRGGGVGRWVLLGCGCFIVLCVIGSVIGGIVIDQACLWKDPPISDVLDLFGYEADISSAACQE